MKAIRVGLTLDQADTEKLEKIVGSRGWNRAIRVYLRIAFQTPQYQEIQKLNSNSVVPREVRLYRRSVQDIDKWIKETKQRVTPRPKLNRSLLVRWACRELLQQLEKRGVESQPKVRLGIYFPVGTQEKLDKLIPLSDRSETIEQFLINCYESPEEFRQGMESLEASEQIQLSLRQDVIDKFDEMADSKGVSRTYVIRHVVHELILFIKGRKI